MKKEKDYLIPLLIALFIFAAICSCNVTKNRVVEGRISHIQGRTVTVNGNTFRVLTNDSLWINKWVSFTSTVNRKKVNSKRIYEKGRQK